MILLDIMMPRMDGPAFRRAQRDDPALASIPVIVMSASKFAQQAVDDMEADGFLPKPPILDVLLIVVRRYCGPAVPN